MTALSRLRATVGGVEYLVDLRNVRDISIWLEFNGPQPNAFGLPMAHSAPFAAGSFVASVHHGAGFNCDVVHIAPHGNGTHTECAGHICTEDVYVHHQIPNSWMAATVLSVRLRSFGQTEDTYAGDAQDDDLVITAAALHEAFELIDADPVWFDAIVIRTYPNDRGKCYANYTGENPAYLTREAMQWVCNRGVSHLLLDLPSVDREEDSGELINHHTFWRVPQGTNALQEESLMRTITEMIWVDDAIIDGPYLLSLNVPAWQSDAATSRPLLYPIERL